MIELSNGYQFEYMIASGAVRFGEGWLVDRILTKVGLLDLSIFDVAVTKTVTRYPRQGRYVWYKPWNSIRFIEDGIANSVKLTNPGIEWWCRKIGPKIDDLEIPPVVSIFSDSDNVNEIKEMATMLDQFDLVGIELNESCPSADGCHLRNAKKVIADCQTLFENSRHPIILKLSAIHSIEKIIPNLEGIIEAIAINSVSWSIAFPNCETPFPHLEECGVSGKAAQPINWQFVGRIVEITNIPVIGPSVWEFSDIKKLEKLGAKAFSFGSIFFHPLRLRKILKSIEKENRTLK